MKPLHLEVPDNVDPQRGRKVYDQKIYVSAFERGTRDRSPRRVEPLPDRIELKICPQNNQRGRMKYYRARSIPELCRVTLKPTGETSQQQGRMEEIYITQYTHAFDRQIEKPHVVAWRRAFEDCDVAHGDSKLCILNSPVGSKPGAFPERRRSAPPGSFVFNYDALDMPEPIHRRSKSLGMSMDDPFGFDEVDTPVGEDAGRNMGGMAVQSSGGNPRGLAHERISAQKVNEVESFDSKFWDEDFGSSYGDNASNSRSRNGVRNNGVAIDKVVNNDDLNSATTNTTTRNVTGSVSKPHGAIVDDFISYQIGNGDVMNGDVESRNGYSIRGDDQTDGGDSPDYSTQDPTNQARSLISTLRSSMKKPDSETFLRSVHSPRTRQSRPESTGRNRSPRRKKSKEPMSERDVLSWNKAYVGGVKQEFPQKVTPRILSNPSTKFTYQSVSQYEFSSRKISPKETTPGRNEPQEVPPSRQFGSEVNTRTSGSPAMEKPGNHSAYSHRPSLGLPGTDKKYHSPPGSELNASPHHDWPPQEFKVGYSQSTPVPDDIKPVSEESSLNSDPSVVKGSPDENPVDKRPLMMGEASSIESSVDENKLKPENEKSMTSSSFAWQGLSITENPSSPMDVESRDNFTNQQPKSVVEPVLEQVISEQNESFYHQEPSFEDEQAKTLEAPDSTYPRQFGAEDHSNQPGSTVNAISEQVTRDYKMNYFQLPDLEIFTTDPLETEEDDDRQRPVEDTVYTKKLKSLSDDIPEAEPRSQGEEPEQEVKRFKTNENLESSPPSEGEDSAYSGKPSSSLNTTSGPSVEVRKVESFEPDQSIRPKRFKSTVYMNGNSKSPSIIIHPGEQTTEPNEDYYKQPSFELMRENKQLETDQNGYPKQDENTVDRRSLRYHWNATHDVPAPIQNESYYHQPNPEVKRVETKQASPSKHVEGTVNKKLNIKSSSYVTPGKPTSGYIKNGDYYQQPNFDSRNEDTQRSRQEKSEIQRNYTKSTYIISEKQSTYQNEQYYQQPKSPVKVETTPPPRIELETNEDLYEEPTDENSNFLPEKCPAIHGNDYKKPLPVTPTQLTPNESYYEVPNNSNLSSTRCPLDDEIESRNHSTNHYEETVEHIYEQPNFSGERIYEEYDYEKMNPPSKLAGTSLYKVPKTTTDVVHDEPDSKLGYEVMKPSQFQDFETFKPKAELSGNFLQGNLKESEIPKNKLANRSQQSSSSLWSNGQASRVTYNGEVSSKKPVKSTTSSVGIDQADARISDDSPRRNSEQSLSSEEDLRPQKPEAEVVYDTPKKTFKRMESREGEVSHPSLYSKTSNGRANSGNTSLARFSSFNSDASYKRRLTSAWIEQQRINFKREVSREPSLRRTKSVELHKQRRGESSDHKLKHSKSELDFERLDAMYNPFDDKYFEPNPSKHQAKVVHIPASGVITKANSLERNTQKFEDATKVSKANGANEPAKDRLLPLTPLEKDTEVEYNQRNLSQEKPQQSLSKESPVKLRDGSNNRLATRPKSADVSRYDIGIGKNEDKNFPSSENEPRMDKKMEGTNSSQNKPIRVRPKSVDVSEIDIRTYNEEARSLAMKEKQDKMTTNLSGTMQTLNTAGPKSAEVSRFDDMTIHHDRAVNLSSEPVVEKRNELSRSQEGSDSKRGPKVRPKSADVSGFDATSYYDEPTKLHGDKDVVNPTQRPRSRPKSADVSGFDITSFADEPMLKQSKSEVSVDQLKAMYDPYDQNSWFSPEAASRNVDQSDSRFADREVLHRRSRSEPESRPERFENGGKIEVSEDGIEKEELGSLEKEPVANITKLSGSSVLLLNVVEVGPNGDPKNPKFKRNAVGRSTSNIVSITAGEIGSDKQVAMRESTRKAKKMEVDTTQKDGKPIVKQRARYIIGGERASVRYLSKSTDELASNDTKKTETLPQPQDQSTEKPMKTSKKDGGFRNFFGRIRKSKSEPNLDKNFSVFDVDSDLAEKKEGPQKQGEKDEGLQETSPAASQEKLPSSSKSGLKASSFYPKLKNFKKNFSKSKQNKAGGSLKDSSVDSGQDISKSEDRLERAALSDDGIKRETVQLSESAGDAAAPDDIGNKPIDSSISSRSTNPTSPRESYIDSTEVSKNVAQVERSSNASGRENEVSPSSLVTSPKSKKKRFFPGGIRVIPVSSVVKQHTSDSMLTSDGIRKSEIRGTVFSTSESDKGPTKDLVSPESTENQTAESKERKTGYRVTEVTSRSTISSKKGVDNGSQNGSRFVRSSTSEEESASGKLPAKSTAYITNQSSSDGVVLRRSARNAKQTSTSTDPNLRKPFKDIDLYNQDGRSGNMKSSSVENLLSSTRVTAWETQNRQRYSLHEDSTIFKSDGHKKPKDIAGNQFKAGYPNGPNNQQRNSVDEDLRVGSKDDVTMESMTVQIKSGILQEQEVRNGSKSEEDLSKKDSKEPEIASPKTKHRGFFKKRMFSKGGSSSQDEIDSGRKESGKENGLIQSKKEIPTLKDSKPDQNKVEVEVLKNESIEDIEKAKESRPSKMKDEKEKGEFGTKIKGIFTKVLPQKNKTVNKLEKGNDETASDREKAEKLDPTLDENNNTTTIAFATANQKDESKDGEQLVNSRTKSQRAVFVVKHLGESDNEKSRASDDERKRVKRGGIVVDSSNPERRATYHGSKVRHVGDSNTVRVENIEKRISLDERSLKTLATEKNQDGWKRYSGPVTRGISFETPARQDETITKTEVVDNVEAFDLAFDFFEEELNKEENLEETAEKGVRGTEVDTKHSLTNLEEDSNSDKTSEQIKGFTIMHKKTSSLVMSKSLEDSLESIGKEDGIGKEVQGNSARNDLDRKQANAGNMKTSSSKTDIQKTELSKSSQEDENKTRRGTTAFLVNHEDKEQQMKYVEKVMVSVHRGASDVKKLVREPTETTAESNELSSAPVSKFSNHVRSSSGEEGLTHQMSKEDIAKDMSEGRFSYPASMSSKSARPGSGNHVQDDSNSLNIVSTLGVTSEEAKVARSSAEKDVIKTVRKQERSQERALKNSGHVVEEFAVKNEAETTHFANEETNNIDDAGDELLQLIEDQIAFQDTPKQLQPEDSSTPIQDDKPGKHKLSIDEESSLLLSSSREGAITPILVRTASLEVDKTDGAGRGRPLDAEEKKRLGASQNPTTTPGQIPSTAQSSSSILNSLVKSTDVKPFQLSPSGTTTPYSRNQTQSYPSNFQKQRTTNGVTVIPSVERQNGSNVERKLTRPKSQLYKEAKNDSATVSKSQENIHFQEVKISRDAMTAKTVTGTNFASQQKQKPPPVPPKPKRNKGGNGVKDPNLAVLGKNGVSQAERTEERPSLQHHQRKPAGFMDVQNSSLSFVNFQSSRESYNARGADEQKMLNSSNGNERVGFTSSTSFSTQTSQDRLASRGVTVHTFKQLKSEDNDAMKKNESKEVSSISKSMKQRKKKGTTASDTSEDLLVRLQRLLCDDELLSEPEDSSISHNEVSSAIYSFSEDSEFDPKLMERVYKSLERPRKIPATQKNPRSSNVPIDDDSSDDEFTGRKEMKFNYKIHSKTL
ncbi:microtubule-associated protein futsch-like [Dendronephthya gigantea]|uniref:microtubule-associated protein futsch-like n=1 Tax=Dendronephthya gigantea TaxID=151771 RepID=UPI00106C28FD|nr:microtubule-associated protein futsch-like [Dendronephthya gigantea]XP_028406752.1 microtubule-associated protein futsch-like [Dendronephthya gigantea]